MWDKDTDKMIWWPPEVEDCTSKYHLKDLHQNKNFHWIFQSRSFKDEKNNINHNCGISISPSKSNW